MVSLSIAKTTSAALIGIAIQPAYAAQPLTKAHIEVTHAYPKVPFIYEFVARIPFTLTSPTLHPPILNHAHITPIGRSTFEHHEKTVTFRQRYQITPKFAGEYPILGAKLTGKHTLTNAEIQYAAPTQWVEIQSPPSQSHAWLPDTNLTVKEQWQIPPLAGQAIVRTLWIEGTLSNVEDWLNAPVHYPDHWQLIHQKIEQPKSKTLKLTHTLMTTKRVETRVPAFRLAWFNLNEGHWQYAQLPEKIVYAEYPPKSHAKIGALALFLLAFGGGGWWRFRQRQKPPKWWQYYQEGRWIAFVHAYRQWDKRHLSWQLQRNIELAIHQQSAEYYRYQGQWRSHPKLRQLLKRAWKYPKSR